MPSNRDVQNTIRLYLVGRLDGGARDDFEKRLLTEDDLFDELLALEDELIDEYLSSGLGADEKAMFEKNFLATPERRQKLRFARALRKYVTTHPSEERADVLKPARASWSWARAFFNPYVRTAAFASLIIVAALGVWRIFFVQSDVDKALLALDSAYREQRPLESRITRFNYAPFLTTRGPSANVDQNELRTAELTLLEALKNKPTPAVHHALGKVYLAKKDFDKAIEHFDEALKGDPNSAQIYADLGAAWLEKGKISLDTGRNNQTSSESGKGMEELGRSLENLNKTLALDNALLEALFNRALAAQYLTLYAQAEQDWREYLKRDSSSPWAEEARKNLKLLEERKARTSATKEQLIGAFRKAYETQNNDAAWAALGPSRARTGNAIVEALIDDQLKFEAEGRSAEANANQQMLSYAGNVEEAFVQDRFTLDLARVYGSSTSKQRATLVRARELMKLGVQLYDRAEYKLAMENFSRAREFFAEATDDAGTLFAEAWVGYCHLRIPDPESGIRTFEHLSKVFQAKGYRSLYAQSLLALADARTGLNEFSKVLEQARESLAVSEQIQDHANAIRCLQAQTSIQLMMSNYRESLAATLRALRLTETLPPDAKLKWPFYHEASINFYFLGLPSVALQFEKEALSLALAGGLRLHASRAYDRLALIYERLNDFDQALKNSELACAEGLKVSDERVKTNILAHSALNFGRLYLAIGKPQQALESYDQAVELYGKLKLDIYQYQSRKGRLLALLELGNDAAVEAELDTVVFWFEQNREKIAEESYRNKFFEGGQNAYDIAVDFHYFRKKDVRKALDYAEASRARSLIDLKSPGAQLTGDAQNPELKLATSTSPLKLIQIQQQLPKQTQLVQYSLQDDKVLAWVVTKENLKSGYTSINRSELDEKIRRYSRMLSRPASTQNDEINNLARELYTILIKPVEGYLDTSSQLCIVPDDNLSFVPFAALVSPTSGRYLVEDYAIQTAPSATIFIDSSAKGVEREKIESERLLIVGNPTFDREQFPGVPYLPGAEREAKEVAHLYGAAPLVRNAAVATRVKRSLGEADVVHLATHAILDEGSPLLSKLLLSTDESKGQLAHHAARSVLQSSEIYGMKFPRTRLVVLSACQTGIERAYRGEGAIGLARPFIAAGVPLVIATLWPVESESTADLMISFHKHRKQSHLSTVEALRRAQLEILHQQQPGSPKNYGWAAFVVIGGYANF